MSAYVPPFIDAAGFHVSPYSAILALFLQNLQAIYGPGIYLGLDSADYQMVSIYALAASDCNSAAQLDFNSHGPNFAIGPALDGLVKLNGLARKVATFSTCQVTVTGVAGTVITDGLVRDSVPQQGVLWTLPTPITIPSGGTLNTVATCQVLGALNALPGQLNIIAGGLTSGWIAVTNPVAAILGQPVETDSQLRTRQAISTELPSITTLAGTIADVAAVSGVTRYNIVENPTNVVDSNGNPPHSITAVVEGGTNLDIATAIYNNRGIGCFTNGTTSQNVSDPNTGVIFTVNFDRPAYVQIYIGINIHPLLGYSSSVGQNVQAALVEYLNSLQIGELVTQSALYAVAMSAAADLELPSFSIKQLFLGIAPSPAGTADIPMTFVQVAQTSAAQVQVNTV